MYTFFQAKTPKENSIDTWQWYSDLIGAKYDFHPGIHTAVLNIENNRHPATAHLPSSWIVTDEWYDFRELSDNINVLVTIDENTYPGDKMGNYHPVVWYQDSFEGGGRSFYTALGHPEELYDDPLYQQHILGALWWAATGTMLDTEDRSIEKQ